MAAAYAALLSLLQTIHDIQNHPSPPILLDNQQVESLTDFVGFLQEFLEGYVSPDADGDEADPLEMRIADAAYAVQDVIESHIVDNIKSDAEDNIQPSGSSKKATLRHFFNCFQSQKNPIKNEETNLYEDVQQVMVEMDLIKKELMKRENSGIVIHEQSQRFFSASHVNSSSSFTYAAGKNDGMVC